MPEWLHQYTTDDFILCSESFTDSRGLGACIARMPDPAVPCWPQLPLDCCCKACIRTLADAGPYEVSHRMLGAVRGAGR